MSISFSNDLTARRSGGFALHATQWFAQLRADWRRQAEARRAERRLQAELAALSPRERLDIDVIAGNLAWSGKRR